MGCFRHAEEGRCHTVISVDNRQRVTLVEADQQNGVWHMARRRSLAISPGFFQEPTLLSTSVFRFNTANHFRQVEAASGEAPPLVARE